MGEDKEEEQRVKVEQTTMERMAALDREANELREEADTKLLAVLQRAHEWLKKQDLLWLREAGEMSYLAPGATPDKPGPVLENVYHHLRTTNDKGEPIRLVVRSDGETYLAVGEHIEDPDDLTKPKETLGDIKINWGSKEPPTELAHLRDKYEFKPGLKLVGFYLSGRENEYARYRAQGEIVEVRKLDPDNPVDPLERGAAVLGLLEKSTYLGTHEEIVGKESKESFTTPVTQPTTPAAK